MSTAAFQLTQSQIDAILDTPQRITSEPLQHKTPYAKRLAAHGLDKKAARVTSTASSFLWYRSTEDNSDAWSVPQHTSMLRSDPYKARQLTTEHETTYARFPELIATSFTRLDFRFKEVTPALSQEIVRTIRAAADKILPRSIDKLGGYADKWNRYDRNVKVLYPGPVDAAMRARLVAMAPAGIDVQHHTFAKADFPRELRLWSNADLPATETGRADFEAFIDGVHQVKTHKMSKEDRSKFALLPPPCNANLVEGNPLQSPNDPSMTSTAPSKPLPEATNILPDQLPERKPPKPYVPRSPKTGRYARFVSVVVDRSVQVEDILPQEWFPLPKPD